MSDVREEIAHEAKITDAREFAFLKLDKIKSAKNNIRTLIHTPGAPIKEINEALDYLAWIEGRIRKSLQADEDFYKYYKILKEKKEILIALGVSPELGIANGSDPETVELAKTYNSIVSIRRNLLPETMANQDWENIDKHFNDLMKNTKLLHEISILSSYFSFFSSSNNVSQPAPTGGLGHIPDTGYSQPNSTLRDLQNFATQPFTPTMTSQLDSNPRALQPASTGVLGHIPNSRYSWISNTENLDNLNIESLFATATTTHRNLHLITNSTSSQSASTTRVSQAASTKGHARGVSLLCGHYAAWSVDDYQTEINFVHAPALEDPQNTPMHIDFLHDSTVARALQLFPSQYLNLKCTDILNQPKLIRQYINSMLTPSNIILLKKYDDFMFEGKEVKFTDKEKGKLKTLVEIQDFIYWRYKNYFTGELHFDKEGKITKIGNLDYEEITLNERKVLLFLLKYLHEDELSGQTVLPQESEPSVTEYSASATPQTSVQTQAVVVSPTKTFYCESHPPKKIDVRLHESTKPFWNEENIRLAVERANKIPETSRIPEIRRIMSTELFLPFFEVVSEYEKVVKSIEDNSPVTASFNSDEMRLMENCPKYFPEFEKLKTCIVQTTDTQTPSSPQTTFELHGTSVVLEQPSSEERVQTNLAHEITSPKTPHGPGFIGTRIVRRKHSKKI
ncbi:MAG: hypothetical protein LBJ09_02140 [Clostridiales bacterium]|nr:hypothetical protein [Clostridiales bacterium]